MNTEQTEENFLRKETKEQLLPGSAISLQSYEFPVDDDATDNTVVGEGMIISFRNF